MNILQNVSVVDLIFLGVLIAFVLMNKGFINTVIEILGFCASLGVALLTYSWIGKLLLYLGVKLPYGMLYALAFLIAWFLSEIICSLLFEFITSKIPPRFQKHRVNKVLGYFAGAVQSVLLSILAVSVLFTFPVRGDIKQAIADSHVGPIFLSLSQGVQTYIKSVFGNAISETISFMTVKPASGSTVDLGFRVAEKNIQPDRSSESIMVDLVNKERAKAGREKLEVDVDLIPIARGYAKEMLVNGFFSHTSKIDSSTVAERVTRNGITFVVVGENLAFAPDVYQAHIGLMNSEGHRHNILLQDYHHVGIGIMDGGVYGKMFVQIFKE